MIYSKCIKNLKKIILWKLRKIKILLLGYIKRLRLSLNEDLYDCLIKDYGNKLENVINSLDFQSKIFIRVNTSLISRDKLIDWFL